MPASPASTSMPVNASTTACPAVMFAYKRIVSANGFVSFPSNSTGVMMISMIGFMSVGTPCGMKKIVLA